MVRAGIIVSGVLIGLESKPDKEGTVKTYAAIAVGMQSYRIGIKAEEVIKIASAPLFEPCCIEARPFVAGGRLYWTDGCICSDGESG